MSQLLHIRPYHSADQFALLELLRLNTPTYFAPEEEADFVHYLHQETEQYFVAEQQEKIVGCGGYNFQEEGKKAHISWDIFHPDVQGMGFGSQLTVFRIQQIRKHPQVETIVVRTTPQVQRFYARFGFETISQQKDYWAPGYDLVHMEMPAKP